MRRDPEKKGSRRRRSYLCKAASSSKSERIPGMLSAFSTCGRSSRATVKKHEARETRVYALLLALLLLVANISQSTRGEKSCVCVRLCVGVISYINRNRLLPVGPLRVIYCRHEQHESNDRYV